MISVNVVQIFGSCLASTSSCIWALLLSLIILLCWLVITMLNKINTFTLFLIFLAYFLILRRRIARFNLDILCETTIVIITWKTFTSIEKFLIPSIVVIILDEWINKILDIWRCLLIYATMIHSLVWSWKWRFL
jgi:hypothetical protein